MHLKHILIILSCALLPQFTSGQEISGRIVDKSTREGIPYVKIYQKESTLEQSTDPKGYFKVNESGDYSIDHPMYKNMQVTIEYNEDTLYLELSKVEKIYINETQLKLGQETIEKFHRYLPETNTARYSEFEFLSSTKIEVYQESSKDEEKYEFLSSLESLQKNRFKYPDKKYARVVSAHYDNGDSSLLGFIPINSYSFAASNEYINSVSLKYYNPFFKGAGKRYDFALVDSLTIRDEHISVIYFRPNPNKQFIGFKGVLYFVNGRSEVWGGYLMPYKDYKQDFTMTFYTSPTSKETRFLRDLNIVLRLKNIPNFGRNSIVYYDTKNSSPVFETKDTSEAKWVDMALFNYEKDTSTDDTWMMTQIVDKEKLEYIKKDTADRQFVLSNTLKWMYNIYDGKIGYRMRYFDLNNEFAINKFESVRIGIGLQSHEKLSDVFTFGGYLAYGFKDAKMKYGGNMGIYFGKARRNLLSFAFTKDLLEPGLVHYFEERQDLVRNFFTSRMDEYRSLQISINSKINAYLTSSFLFNNYSLEPLYDYIYNPKAEGLTDKQTFNFSETSIFFNIGTPFTYNPNLRNILYRKKRFRSNLYLNLTKGWKLSNGGDYDYWKLNGRLMSNVRVKGQGVLDIVLDGGVMTKDQPYQINYVGPGTEFKLTGIIINNAFQSMKLYGFFADRYFHSFSNLNLGKIFAKRSRFSPELAFALNFGWGKITGRKEIHENIEVRDYPNGYYEAGVLLNNLLRLKIYNYFYGGLGLGTFYGFGPDAENGAWAIRISYELGVL